MAKIGTADVAGRYDGLGAGPRHEYIFEIQEGTPVDGSNASLRQQSPFTLRLLPPDALLEAAALNEDGSSSNVDLITAAAQGASQNSAANQLSTYLSRVSPIEATTAELDTFLASGAVFSGTENTQTLADALAAADIALQLLRILNAPPLTLLVNPSQMSISFTNVQNYATRTRYGFIFERWGEEQPSISFQGVTGAFYAGSGDGVVDARGTSSTTSGMAFANKRDSAAWQNLMSLFQFYRNNGYIYNTTDKSEAHHFVGAVAIDYDQWTYVGHIESFEYAYEAANGNQINWSMEFKVDRMYDNAIQTTSVSPLAGAVSTEDDEYGSVPFDLLV